MWNPKSDKKTEDVSFAETTSEEQQLNIVDDKSQTSNIAGNGKPTASAAAATTKTKKQLEGESSSSSYGGGGGGGIDCTADFSSTISCGGGIDSGFLSGPQLVEDYDDDLKHQQQQARIIPSVQFNIVNKKQLTDDYQDSGCIDEYIAEDEAHHQIHKQKPSITTTAATPQIQQKRTIGGAAVESIVDRESLEEEDSMILDSGVDAGFAEWFCKLNLNNSSQQLNNLGAVSQRNPSQNASNNSKATSEPEARWEIFYQQNNDGDTQLHMACLTGHVEVVAALIRMAPHPCLFNIQNDEAQTVLHLAVLYGQPKILRMLLIAGAEATARDRNGNTPLHLASMSGDTQCVRALTIPISASEINEAHRSYGHLSSDRTTSYLDYAHLPADLELRNYDGERCVHLAAQGGHIDILRHLVWFGADINAREGKSGRTPLHIAIEGCNEILANFLLEECSNLNIETATYAGLTAYQVACVLNNSIMQNNLERRGAELLTPPDSDYESSDIETDLDDSQMFDRFGDPRYFANYNGGNPINVA